MINLKKNFRIILIKILKEKALIDNIVGENENQILFNKLKLHDELKNTVINKLLAKNQENYRKNLEIASKQLKTSLIKVKLNK